MLEKIHKFANATSRPIARYGTRKHTRKWISGVVQPRMSQNVESTKMLLLHNTRETLARLHNRRIRTCAQPTMQNATTSIPSMLYVWYFGAMIQDDRV